MRLPAFDERQSPIVWWVVVTLGVVLSIAGWLRWAT
jgi:hypothetical protein